jgi:hypothetical protein
MGEVIEFKRKTDTDYKLDEGELVDTSALQLTQYEFQMQIKDFLDKEDYDAVLLGIMDLDYYIDLEPELQELVDIYQSYDGVINA